MPDLDDINDAIAENAASGLKRVRVGNQEVESFSPKEQADAASQVANQQAVTRPGFGLRFQQIVPVYR